MRIHVVCRPSSREHTREKQRRKKSVNQPTQDAKLLLFIKVIYVCMNYYIKISMAIDNWVINMICRKTTISRYNFIHTSSFLEKKFSAALSLVLGQLPT